MNLARVAWDEGNGQPDATRFHELLAELHQPEAPSRG